MKSSNTIHINGKLYDARTGELVNNSKASKASAPSHAKKTHAVLNKTSHSKPKSSNNQNRGRGLVDGITKNPKSNKVLSNSKKRHPNTKQTNHKYSVKHHISHAKRSLKHSPTLNRSGVKAPSISSPEAKNHQSAEKKTNQPNIMRLERASAINRSSVISRFSSSIISKNTTDITVIKKGSGNQSSMSNNKSSTKKSSPINSHSVNHHIVSESLSVDNSSTKKIKAPRTKHSPKIFHFVSGGLAALVLVGYVAYLNVPSVSVKVASSRAGFAATLPGQTPAGYKIESPVAYSPGQVIINFGSNTDDRHFSIQQQPTTWDSVALKENFVAKNSTVEPQIYNDQGLTIYLYNNGDAAWVNDGKFYSISSDNSQLDPDQILGLATSM